MHEKPFECHAIFSVTVYTTKYKTDGPKATGLHDPIKAIEVYSQNKNQSPQFQAQPRQNLASPTFRPIPVLVHLHANHPLGLVPIQLIVLILYSVLLRRVLLVWITQSPTTDASTVVIVIVNVGTPTKFRQSQNTQGETRERHRNDSKNSLSLSLSLSSSKYSSCTTPAQPPFLILGVSSPPNSSSSTRTNSSCPKYPFASLLPSTGRLRAEGPGSFRDVLMFFGFSPILPRRSRGWLSERKEGVRREDIRAELGESCASGCLTARNKC